MILNNEPWNRSSAKLTGQTDRADKSDVDDVFMAETGSSEVDFVLARNCHDMPHRGRREERHLVKEVVSRNQLISLWGTCRKVLQESIASLEIYIRSPCQVRCLLKEHGLFSVYFANIDSDSLITVHQRLSR
jgi:hypothetical protein